MIIIRDIDNGRFLDDNGMIRNNFMPAIAFGMKPTWEINWIHNDGSPVDLSAVVAWRAAIDNDFLDTTDVMCRTLLGITVDGNKTSVPLNANTVNYRAKTNGKDNIAAYFELTGLDANGDRVFWQKFPIRAHYVIDPDLEGELEEVPSSGGLDATEVAAIAQAIVDQALANYQPPMQPGPAGPAPILQYSANAIAWHSTWQDGDLYARISSDNGETWGPAMRWAAGQAALPEIVAYDPAKVYVIGQVVAYGDPAGIYQCIVDANYSQSPASHAEKWRMICSPGATGQPGATWLSASGEPDAEVGSDGDHYLDLDTYNHYLKSSGVWLQRGCLRGQDGAGIVWRGAWSASAQYLPGDAVSKNGSLWRATAAHSNQEPPDDPETASVAWEIFLARGQAGAPGTTGTIQIAGINMLSPTSDPYASEAVSSTPARRLYILNIPRSNAGPAGQLRITMGPALGPDEAPQLIEAPASTPSNRVYQLCVPMGQKGEPGTGLYFNTVGSMTERVNYDASARGFVFACTDILTDDNGTYYQAMYYKRSDDFADWSEPIRLYMGAKGPKGDKGDSVKGDPGDAAFVKPDHEFIEADLVDRAVVIPDTTPIASVELYDQFGHAHALMLGSSPTCQATVTYRADINKTLVLIAAAEDVTYGGRVRFAQGLPVAGAGTMMAITRLRLMRPGMTSPVHLVIEASADRDFATTTAVINTATVAADRDKVLIWNGAEFIAMPETGIGYGYKGALVLVDMSQLAASSYIRYRWDYEGGDPAAYQYTYFPSCGEAGAVGSVGVATTGSLQVTLAGDLSGAGRWSIDDGATWRVSGEVVDDLPPWTFTVKFKDVDGYTTPASTTATVTAGELAAITATYVSTSGATGHSAYIIQGSTPILLTDQADPTKCFGSPTGYGYYIINGKLYTYDGSLIQIGTADDWKAVAGWYVSSRGFGWAIRGNGKLYVISDRKISQIGIDEDWTAVTINYALKGSSNTLYYLQGAEATEVLAGMALPKVSHVRYGYTIANGNLYKLDGATATQVGTASNWMSVSSGYHPQDVTYAINSLGELYVINDTTITRVGTSSDWKDVCGTPLTSYAYGLLGENGDLYALVGTTATLISEGWGLGALRASNGSGYYLTPGGGLFRLDGTNQPAQIGTDEDWTYISAPYNPLAIRAAGGGNGGGAPSGGVTVSGTNTGLDGAYALISGEGDSRLWRRDAGQNRYEIYKSSGYWYIHSSYDEMGTGEEYMMHFDECRGDGTDPWTAIWETSWEDEYGYPAGNGGATPTVTGTSGSGSSGTGSTSEGYQVSNAGMTAVNGVYTPNGNIHNGEPVYAFVNGDTTYYLHYQVNDENEYAWAICNAVTDSHGPEFVGYYHCNTITGTWTNNNMLSPGASPAPTVTGTPAA